jgi:hypothetical protein
MATAAKLTAPGQRIGSSNPDGMVFRNLYQLKTSFPVFGVLVAP